MASLFVCLQGISEMRQKDLPGRIFGIAEPSRGGLRLKQQMEIGTAVGNVPSSPSEKCRLAIGTYWLVRLGKIELREAASKTQHGPECEGTG